MWRSVVSLLQEKFRNIRKPRVKYSDDWGDDCDNLAGKISFPASFFLIKENRVKQAEIRMGFGLGTVLDYVNLNNKKHGVL